MLNNAFTRYGYAAGMGENEFGGYIYMRDNDTFEIGTYDDVGTSRKLKARKALPSQHQ